jgi:23S rRNA pseudouridine1911/1915/1917 synthase
MNETSENIFEKIKIIYESKDVIAINKPAGIVVHSDGKNPNKTLTDWILEKYPESIDVGEPIEMGDSKILRPGIVHRLDKDTSGVMLIAKTKEGFENLKQQFQDRTIQKNYHAFVYGNIREELTIIDKPIGRSSKDIRKWSSLKDARGQMREALTLVRVLNRGNYQGEIFTYIEAEPKTGRTHQIRVHLRAIEKPIVCDSLYAPNRECILGFGRLALHARQISFFDTEGERVTVEAEFPEDFEKALKHLHI